ncbi:hypothetical protein JHK84_040467 [Glycine max]|nr:hypothetical protein JHK84_040467 [Glycine max]
MRWQKLKNFLSLTHSLSLVAAHSLSLARRSLILPRLLQVNNSICIEKFSDFPQLGRFTLRTEGKTVAMEKATGL